MDSELQRLVAVTHEMKQQLEAEAYEACAACLREREELLARLQERYGVAPPADVVKVLTEVRDLDRTLSERLREGLKETSREMARAAEIRKRKTAAPAMAYSLDKRA